MSATELTLLSEIIYLEINNQKNHNYSKQSNQIMEYFFLQNFSWEEISNLFVELEEAINRARKFLTNTKLVIQYPKIREMSVDV